MDEGGKIECMELLSKNLDTWNWRNKRQRVLKKWSATKIHRLKDLHLKANPCIYLKNRNRIMDCKLKTTNRRTANHNYELYLCITNGRNLFLKQDRTRQRFTIKSRISHCKIKLWILTKFIWEEKCIKM